MPVLGHPGTEPLGASLAGLQWRERLRWWLEVWDELLGGFPGCDICGRVDDIDLVHKDFDHFGFEQWEDLVPLCPDCRDAVAVHIHAAATRRPAMPYHLAFTAAAAAVRRART